MDVYSDVDLVLLCERAHHEALMQDLGRLAGALGPLVAAFTGEHVGEPRLLICLYGPPALHVDLKLLTLADLAHRVDEPVVLWERDGRMSAAYATRARTEASPDPQWIEARFWVWVHYAALKIARGEFQEAFDFLSYVRVAVLGPLGAMRGGRAPNGVRRVEADPTLARQLAGTIGALDARALTVALGNAIEAYRELRPASVERNTAAERVATAFLRDVASSAT